MEITEITSYSLWVGEANGVPISIPPPPPVVFDERWRLPKEETLPSSRPRSSSKSSRMCPFNRRCARLFREQRARFYIMRRCVAMLVCYGDP
ncbi:hypothetical protein MLD38_011151 [Melastoma candidum]|uniref:Uncharacterized protein n=1 Tax=Melastoma candidum TaxID=119954 RepID=A0ACB9R245_9MYRT|nr:hypothetical protein MLD38_011151 [Melastoma candidum]